MTYRSRKIEADGRVYAPTHVILDPANDDLATSRLFGSWGVDCGSPNLAHNPKACGVCRPAATWFEGAANTWDAPDCGMCDVRDTPLVAPAAGKPNCDDCNDSGVDETVPLHMVNIGSTIAMRRWPAEKTSLVVDVDYDTVTVITGFGEHEASLYTLPISLLGPGKPWMVVRAVPWAPGR
jgi:hypothetical protein